MSSQVDHEMDYIVTDGNESEMEGSMGSYNVWANNCL